MGAINGVGGVLYGHALVNLATGEKITIAELIAAVSGALPEPTATTRGGVLKQGVHPPLVQGEDLSDIISDYNHLLTELRDAGILTKD